MISQWTIFMRARATQQGAYLCFIRGEVLGNNLFSRKRCSSIFMLVDDARFPGAVRSRRAAQLHAATYIEIDDGLGVV